MQMKIVVNECYGGFNLSEKAYQWLKEHGAEEKEYDYYNKNRDDPLLVRCVETLGSKVASGSCAELAVTTFNIEVEIDNYDGMESASVYGSEEYCYD